jgi:hypothetical protein
MPDEVFKSWLEPIAIEYGWPFNSPSDHIDETNKWSSALGRRSLIFWVSALWEFKKINLAMTPLCNISCVRIRGIINFCEHGIPTLTAGVAGTVERFRACADYIRLNGGIPSPIVVMLRDDRLEIIDGYHRIAALIHVAPLGCNIVPAWITKANNDQT